MDAITVTECESQCSPIFQPFGRVMCTTACLHMAVAFVTGHIIITGKQEKIRQRVMEIMHISSRSHANKGVLSVFEALKKVDTKRLGLCVQEFICLHHSATVTKKNDDGIIIQGKQAIVDKAKSLAMHNNTKVAGIITHDNHSICIMYCPSTDRYALFDSMPSKLVSNIQEASLVSDLIFPRNLLRYQYQHLDVTFIFKKLE